MSELPISVIIPFSEKRDTFFYRFCLPSIESNNPKEIFIESGEGSAPYKRNRGAEKATQDYLFFCDDDTILGHDCLKKMWQAIDGKEEGFAYCHYIGIVTKEEAHPIGKTFLFNSQPFDAERLKRHNYIDTMSLIKREHFPGFDESLHGFQDWDLWLTIAKQGTKGHFIDDFLYMTFFFDKGISTDAERARAAKQVVKRKHGA